MAEVQKINVGPALTVPLALACRGGQLAKDASQKFAPMKDKITEKKDHPRVAQVLALSDVLWSVLGMVMIFHGAQFKNLFLCTQVVLHFCYDRVKGSISDVYTNAITAFDKVNDDDSDDKVDQADAKAEPKPDNKHAQKRAAKQEGDKPAQQQREEDAAATKKLLKVLDSEKVRQVFVELLIAAMACHMVMEGGLVTKAVVAHALVKATKDKLLKFLDFSEHDGMEAWMDMIINFVLYSVFIAAALLVPSLALAMNVALCGAELVATNALSFAEKQGKLPESMKDATKALALLAGLAVFGTVWQFWALLAESGMAWYFKIVYLPAYVAESIISLL
jgi:hypothetical protein